MEISLKVEVPKFSKIIGIKGTEYTLRVSYLTESQARIYAGNLADEFINHWKECINEDRLK